MHADLAEITAAPRAVAAPKRGDVGKVRLLTLADLDGRTRAHREVVRLIDAVIDDLGGPDVVSTAQREIVESGCLLAVMGKDLGARWLAGASVDCTTAATLANAMRRQFETAGIRRHRDAAGPAVVVMSADDQALLGDAEKPAHAPAVSEPDLSAVAATLRHALAMPDCEPAAAPLRLVDEKNKPGQVAQVSGKGGRVSPSPSAPSAPQPGERETVADGTGEIVFLGTERDGRERWGIFDVRRTDRACLGVWMSRDEARARAERLHKDGKL